MSDYQQIKYLNHRYRELTEQATARADTYRAYVTLGMHIEGVQPDRVESDLVEAIEAFQKHMEEKTDVLCGVLIEEATVVCGEYEEPLRRLVLEQYPRFPQNTLTLDWYVTELALHVGLVLKQERVSVTTPSTTYVYELSELPKTLTRAIAP